MGADPDQIQREIAEQREEISRKVRDLEVRVRDDLRTVWSRVSGDGAGGEAGGLNLESRVSEHPLTFMAGGLALGVALGALTEGLSLRGGGRTDRGEPAGRGRAGPGMLGRLLLAVQGPVEGEIREFVRYALAGFGEEERRRAREPETADVQDGRH